MEREKAFLWARLYEYSHRLPFVSTSHGRAFFQSAEKNSRLLIAIGASGFVVRPE